MLPVYLSFHRATILERLAECMKLNEEYQRQFQKTKERLKANPNERQFEFRYISVNQSSTFYGGFHLMNCVLVLPEIQITEECLVVLFLFLFFTEKLTWYSAVSYAQKIRHFNGKVCSFVVVNCARVYFFLICIWSEAFGKNCYYCH